MARKQSRSLVACPACSGHRVGRIGTRQYFCSDCCLEFVVRSDRVELFEVDEEGNLVTAGRRWLTPAPVLETAATAPISSRTRD